MTRYTIDPAMLVRLAQEEVALRSTTYLVAPHTLRSEALALLLERVRDGRLSEGSALTLHERMTSYRIRLLGDRVTRRRAWSLALAHGWDDLRDAEYIAVTQLQADALVTSDPRLAARAAQWVEVRDYRALRATSAS